MSEDLIQLTSYDDVLDVLGGARAVSKLCKQKNANAAFSWRSARGQFPSKYFVKIQDALGDKGYWASHSLFTFHGPRPRKLGPKRKVQSQQAA